jgi:predicted nuclease of predicted toxin-antitoxin system
VNRQRSRTPKPQVRLLWDELLSPLVPQALRILGFNTSYIGNDLDGQPPKGTPDEDIVAHSLQRNLIIVTSNHDMMEICAEAGQRFVWVDPRRRQLRQHEQVLLVFQQIARWQLLLDAEPTMCVRAMRTKCSTIAPLEAARLVSQRSNELARRKRLAARKSRPTVDTDELL